MKIFTDVGKKKQEEIGIFLFEKGENCNFWPKYLPLIYLQINNIAKVYRAYMAY